jgi:OHCU decarboxylase
MASPPYEVMIVNRLSDAQFIEQFSHLSNSRRWVSELLRRRPFATTERLFDDAADVWWNVCTLKDWIEAFNGRAPIGDQVSSENDLWSVDEDALTLAAPKHIADELFACNGPYRDKFGYVWIQFCEGLTAEQQLANFRRRIENDPETELRENCVEEFKITIRRLRLTVLGRDPYAKMRSR